MDNRYINKQIGISNTQKGNDEATTRLIADFSGSPPYAFCCCKGKAAAGKIRCGFWFMGWLPGGSAEPQHYGMGKRAIDPEGLRLPPKITLRTPWYNRP